MYSCSGSPKFEYDMNSLNGMQNLYDQLTVEPDEFGVGSHRFTLRSNEGDLFFVHTFVFEMNSTEVNTLLKANTDGILEGNPLPVDMSTLALSALLDLLYLQTEHSHIESVLADVLRTAHAWQMQGIVTYCIHKMKYCVDNKLNEDFDSLLQWFVLAVQLEITVGDMEGQMISQLMRLANQHRNGEKLGMLKAQLAEYIKDKSHDQILDLFVVKAYIDQ